MDSQQIKTPFLYLQQGRRVLLMAFVFGARGSGLSFSFLTLITEECGNFEKSSKEI
jgi:hypothetical protein